MSDWISINDALPPVGKIVEYQGQGEHVFKASLFDVDHTKPDALIRFLLHDADKIQFVFPKCWRPVPELHNHPERKRFPGTVTAEQQTDAPKIVTENEGHDFNRGLLREMDRLFPGTITSDELTDALKRGFQ